MRRLILLAALAAVAGCAANGPPPLAGFRSKGHSEATFAADGAQCRNQARAIVGMNQNAWFWPTYTDCMLGKGYAIDNGRPQ